MGGGRLKREGIYITMTDSINLKQRPPQCYKAIILQFKKKKKKEDGKAYETS